MTGIFYKERVGDADTHTQGGRPCKDGNRDWSHAVTSQEMSRIAGTTKSWEEAREESFLEPSKGAWPCRHLAFRLI